MDRGAWGATVHGVTKSQTWLKRLSTHMHQPPGTRLCSVVSKRCRTSRTRLMHELPCLGFCGILCKAKDAGWPPSALPETLCASGPGRPGRRRTSSPGAHLPPGNCTSEVMSRAPLTFLFSPFHLFLFLFVFSLSPPSPLCSRDAAKRKAWKLNRVGSLRNIYSSSTNTEGNAPDRKSVV